VQHQLLIIHDAIISTYMVTVKIQSMNSLKTFLEILVIFLMPYKKVLMLR